MNNKKSSPSFPSAHGKLISLREYLQEHPKNVRARAELACILELQAQQEAAAAADKDDEDKAKRQRAASAALLHREAVEFAESAIVLSPEKPFGYAALSMMVLSDDHASRMENLRLAVERSRRDPSHFRAKIGLMVRLLVEPREEECRARVRGGGGRSPVVHPSRRKLNNRERSLYDELRRDLDEAWSTALAPTPRHRPWSEGEAEFLALREYRLGLFFRKMEPSVQYRDRSRHHFRVARDRLPEHHENAALARFWLATLSEDDKNVHERLGHDDDIAVVSKCPPSYVVGLYAGFASRFDDLLVGKLDYRTPTVLRKVVDSVVAIPAEKWNRGIDLGCGTGLSGLAFRDCVRELVGIDLSPEMVEKAAGRGCYDRLVVGDVTTVLLRIEDYVNEGSLDLIFACDVFVYLGDLSEVFAASQKSLAEGGVFAFSTELLDDCGSCGAKSSPYRLQACARFAHRQSYLDALSTEYGFEVLTRSICPIRKNRGKDIIGILCVLRKTDYLL